MTRWVIREREFGGRENGRTNRGGKLGEVERRWSFLEQRDKTILLNYDVYICLDL